MLRRSTKNSWTHWTFRRNSWPRTTRTSTSLSPGRRLTTTSRTWWSKLATLTSTSPDSTAMSSLRISSNFFQWEKWQQKTDSTKSRICSLLQSKTSKTCLNCAIWTLSPSSSLVTREMQTCALKYLAVFSKMRRRRRRRRSRRVFKTRWARRTSSSMKSFRRLSSTTWTSRQSAKTWTWRKTRMRKLLMLLSRKSVTFSLENLKESRMNFFKETLI